MVQIAANSPANSKPSDARRLLTDMAGGSYKTIDDLNQAICFNRTNADLFRRRGMLYWNKDESDQALANYNEAIRLDSDNPVFFGERGEVLAKRSNVDRAIADFDEAIRLDPMCAKAYLGRGKLWQQTGMIGKAIDDLAEAVRLKPDDAVSCNQLSWCLATCAEAGLRDGKRAVGLATKACELTDWKNDLCVATLAAALAESGDLSEAQRRLQQAIELSPKTHKDIRLKMMALFLEGQAYRDQTVEQPN